MGPASRSAGVLLAAMMMGAGAVRADLAPEKVAAIERIVSSYMAEAGIPGLSIAIALDGEVAWASGYGLADLENYVPAKATTAYRTASIGKSLTATAAMALAEQRLLDLDAPVQSYCRALPMKRWPLTVRHLLSHLGGVRHYGGPRDQEEQLSTHHYDSVVEALAPFKDDPLLFEPGTDYLYSTYGYGVAGCAIEGAGRASYMEVMRQRVFDRAAMTSTRDDDPAAIIENRAAGYRRTDGVLRNAPHVDMSNRLPAGGFVTTVGDLARFAAAYLDCRLVSCASVAAMTWPARLTDGGTVDNYGMGWAIDDTGEVVFHGGSSPGVSGMLYAIPKRRLAVVFLTNLELAPRRFETAAAIAEVVLARPAAAAPPGGV